MSLRVLQVILDCGFLAFVVLLLAVLLWVTARRPADDRDAFIRNFPPPSQPMAVRQAHLRVLVRQEAIKHVKVDGVIAVVLVVLGMSLAASEQAPIGVGIAVAAVVAVSQEKAAGGYPLEPGERCSQYYIQDV
jgi:hypothetical protein